MTQFWAFSTFIFTFIWAFHKNETKQNKKKWFLMPAKLRVMFLCSVWTVLLLKNQKDLISRKLLSVYSISSVSWNSLVHWDDLKSLNVGGRSSLHENQTFMSAWFRLSLAACSPGIDSLCCMSLGWEHTRGIFIQFPPSDGRSGLVNLSFGLTLILKCTVSIWLFNGSRVSWSDCNYQTGLIVTIQIFLLLLASSCLQRIQPVRAAEAGSAQMPHSAHTNNTVHEGVPHSQLSTSVFSHTFVWEIFWGHVWSHQFIWDKLWIS